MKKLLQTAAISFFGVFAALVMIEIGFRCFYDFSPENAEWNDRPEFYFRHEKAETLQDHYHAPQKPADTFRIAVVGDSYSFAPYMQFTDTFPFKLEQMLNLNDVKLKAEVINYGVPAYSISHEVPVVERALREGADLVLLQVTLNDTELKGLVPRGIRPDQEDPFGDIVFTGTLEKVVSYWKSLGFVLTRLHNQKTHNNYRKYFLGLFERKANWQMYLDSFKAIQSLCKKHDKQLIAAIFPLFGIPLDERYPFLPIHEKLAALFETKKVPYLDLYAAYKGMPLDRIQVIPGVDRHGNELTHRVAAEKIYSWLERENFIPEDLKIRYKYTERMGITNIGLIKQP